MSGFFWNDPFWDDVRRGMDIEHYQGDLTDEEYLFAKKKLHDKIEWMIDNGYLTTPRKQVKPNTDNSVPKGFEVENTEKVIAIFRNRATLAYNEDDAESASDFTEIANRLQQANKKTPLERESRQPTLF